MPMISVGRSCEGVSIPEFYTPLPGDPAQVCGVAGLRSAVAMKPFSSRSAKPLLFGAVATVLAVGFIYRRSFFPDIEEIRAREQQKYSEKLQLVLERRERQLLEIEQKKSAR